MDKQDFLEHAHATIKDMDLALTAYSIGNELTGHEAVKLWMELCRLHTRLGEIKNAASDRDPALQD